MLNPKFTEKIRVNSLISMYLLVQSDEIFDQVKDHGVIKEILKICREPNVNQQTLRNASQLLARFAMNQKCNDLLFDYGILDLISKVKLEDSHQDDDSSTRSFIKKKKNI